MRWLATLLNAGVLGWLASLIRDYGWPPPDTNSWVAITLVPLSVLVNLVAMWRSTGTTGGRKPPSRKR